MSATWQEPARPRAELIEIRHGDEGTGVTLDDPSGCELFGLLLVLTAVVVGWSMWCRAKTKD